MGINAVLCHKERLLDGAFIRGTEGGGRGAVDQTQCIHKGHGVLGPACNLPAVLVFGELRGIAGVSVIGVLLHVAQCVAQEYGHLLTVQRVIGGERGGGGTGCDTGSVGLQNIGICSVRKGVGSCGGDALAGESFCQTHGHGAELQPRDGLGVIIAQQTGIQQIVIQGKVHAALRPSACLGGGPLRQCEGAGIQLGAVQRLGFFPFQTCVHFFLILR